VIRCENIQRSNNDLDNAGISFGQSNYDSSDADYSDATVEIAYFDKQAYCK